jgi:lipid-binding SYLF domain-containing protein
MFSFARRPAAAAALLLCSLAPAIASARSEEATIRASHEVLQQFLDLQIRQIPDSLLAEAHGVAIIPDVIKLGFVVGGQRGHGVVIVRERDGSWRAPLFITITGGSVGWQIGAQSTDFMLVFKSQKSVEGLLRGKFTLGADAAVAAGPVGRRAGAATDTELKAEIYSYSRSRGLFAGVSLEGSALQVDDAANAAYYGASLPGAPPPAVPASALRLVEIVAQLTNHATVAPPAANQTFTTPVPGPVAPAATLAPSVPSQHLDQLQARLAQSATQLSPLLDDHWRQYLALPAEVYRPGQRPSPQALEATLARFRAVSQNRQYHALIERPEFHNTHQLLQALYEDLGGAATAPIHLAPPPAVRP